MNRHRLLVFVDNNIIIESLFAPLHPANAIAVLARNKHLDLVTCALVVEDIEKEILDRVIQSGDIPVLASAIEIAPDLILSDNREHFNEKVSERCGIAIWSCEEFLKNMMTGSIKEKLKTAK